ncbi:reactive intermediate/imine deaminase [Xenorhabdus stockiae]|uniref:Reactive intermediate/imine deaminase n=1 Tax=Xenorhabdus stockiae TaxID=351614 RepID=A0A2D0KM55_9GAMM|nr:RidA family protein [Xenorhabdus stockiae]PHM64521.1 reactive intermediate/imine deaminase [Xenorhabdus stockiae]
MTKKTINPETVFNSVQYGFSQAVIKTGTRHLFLSGQVGINKDEETIPGGLPAQTKLALENLHSVIREAGGELSDITMLRIYIKQGAESHENQLIISSLLQQYFPSEPPASSWVIVTGLSLPEWLIEIEAEAILD